MAAAGTALGLAASNGVATGFAACGALFRKLARQPVGLADLEAIAAVESGHNRKAVGKAGERGMYQVGKEAWDDAAARLGAKQVQLTLAVGAGA